MMKRIAIVGCGGAGKSTLARALGNLLHLPVHHLDAELWKPGWVMTEREEELRIIQRLASGSEWIIDGNYGCTMSLRFAAADTIVFLDYNRSICLARVLHRIWTYRGCTRPDMGEGCPEKFDREFVQWIWNYRKICRPKVMREIDKHRKGRQIFIFQHPRETAQFLRQLHSQRHPVLA